MTTSLQPGVQAHISGDKPPRGRIWGGFEFVHNSLSLCPAIQAYERTNPHLAKDYRRRLVANPDPTYPGSQLIRKGCRSALHQQANLQTEVELRRVPAERGANARPKAKWQVPRSRDPAWRAMSPEERDAARAESEQATKARVSARIKEKWADPEYRAKQQASQRRLAADRLAKRFA